MADDEKVIYNRRGTPYRRDPGWEPPKQPEQTNKENHNHKRKLSLLDYIKSWFKR